MTDLLRKCMAVTQIFSEDLSCDIGKHKHNFLGSSLNVKGYKKCDKNATIFDSVCCLGTFSLNALKDLIDCTSTETARIQTIWINNFLWHMTALFSPMTCWGIGLQVICYFVFHLKLSFVQRACLISPPMLQLEAALQKSKPQNYPGLIKIAYAGLPLPRKFKWSSILQEWYSPGTSCTTFSTVTGAFCSNWFWFIHVSTPCIPINTLYALCLLGTSVAVRTARPVRLKDPQFKHRGVISVLRTHP